MDFHLLAAIISSALTIAAVVPYARDMLKGNTRPNIVSWGLWFLIQSIFAAAQFTQGASLSIVLPLVEDATVLLVMVLGLIGYGYKKYGPLDFVCLTLALGAIVLWKTTGDPAVALWFSVAADFSAAMPTLIKSYRDPNSETPATYLLVVLSAIAAGFSSYLIDLPNLLWPAYIFFVNGSILTLILLGKRAKKGSKRPA